MKRAALTVWAPSCLSLLLAGVRAGRGARCRLARGDQHPGRLGAAQGHGRPRRAADDLPLRILRPSRASPARPQPRPSSAGFGSEPQPARAAIDGLSPSTTYHYRLVATNTSGTASAEGTFATTDGFGFLPGNEGFSARAIADGGGADGQAGSHPYQLDFGLGFRRGRGIRGPARGHLPRRRHPGPRDRAAARPVPQPEGDQPNAPRSNSAPRAHLPTNRASPARAARTQARSARSRSKPAAAAAKRAASALFNLTPPPGVAAQIGFAPYGNPGHPRHRDPAGRRWHLLAGAAGAQHAPVARPQRAAIVALGNALGRLPQRRTRELPKRGRARLPLGQMLGRQPERSPPLAFLSLPTRCSGAARLRRHGDLLAAAGTASPPRRSTAIPATRRQRSAAAIAADSTSPPSRPAHRQKGLDRLRATTSTSSTTAKP